MKKILCTGILVLMMAVIISCGNTEQDDQILKDPVDSYRVEKETAVDIDEMSLINCYVTEQHIYYSQVDSGGRSGIWMREFAQEAEPVCVCLFAENEILQTFTMTGSGNVIAAVRDREQGSTWLRKTDKKGEAMAESILRLPGNSFCGVCWGSLRDVLQ